MRLRSVILNFQVVSQPKAVTPVDLSSLDYPELPEEKTTPPPEPQVSQSLEPVPSKGSLQYPTLPTAGLANAHGPFVNPNGGTQESKVEPPSTLTPLHPNGLVPGKQLGELASTVAPATGPSPSHQPSTGLKFQQPAVHQGVPQSQTGVPFPTASGMRHPLPSNVPSSQPGAPLSQPPNPPFGAPRPQFPVSPGSQPIVPNPAGPPAPAPLPNTTVPHPSSQPIFQPGVPGSGPSVIPTTQPSSQSFSAVPKSFPQPRVPSSSPSSFPSTHPVIPSSQPTSSQSTSPPHITPSGPGGSRQILSNSGPTVSPGPGNPPVSMNTSSSIASQVPSVGPTSAASTTVLPSFSSKEPQASSKPPVHSQGPGGTPTSVPGEMPHQVPQSVYPGNQPVSQMPPDSRQGPGQSPLSAMQPQQVASTSIPAGDPRNDQHGGQTPLNTSQVPPYTSVSKSVQHSPQKPTQMPGNSQGTPKDTTKQPDRESAHLDDQKSAKPSQQSLPKMPNSYITTPGLPPGWERVENGGRPYYKDHNTQTTHWELPKAPTTGSNVAATQASGQKQQRPQIKRQSLVDKPTLRRSLSSPNLKKLSDQGSSGHKTPVIDRLSKPDSEQTVPARPVIDRVAKPLSANQLDSFNPSYGGIGAALTGLRNLGNTCYMNSVVQCLSSVAPLAAFFISGAYRDNINRTNRDGTRGRCIYIIAAKCSILVFIFGDKKCHESTCRLSRQWQQLTERQLCV